MTNEEIGFAPATTLAEMIRRKVISPTEVMRATLDRIAEFEPRINAFAYLASDGLDTNACTLQEPCRLLPAALTAVADGVKGGGAPATGSPPNEATVVARHPSALRARRTSAVRVCWVSLLPMSMRHR